jgi:hypothetical protein
MLSEWFIMQLNKHELGTLIFRFCSSDMQNKQEIHGVQI